VVSTKSIKPTISLTARVGAVIVGLIMKMYVSASALPVTSTKIPKPSSVGLKRG
jgi:hypothetical protein